MPRLPDLTALAAKALKLPSPAQRVRVTHEADLVVSTPDGARLLTDTWYPTDRPEAPVVLVRTPYGRGGAEKFLGGFLARHGFRVVIQSCRGTFGSTGPFVPFLTDADDALATVAWLRTQPWFAGKVATYGVSFAGYTAWSMAKNPPPELVAVIPVIAPMNPYSTLFPHGTMSAEVVLTWASLMPDMPSRVKTLLNLKKLKRQVSAAALAMPPVNAYTQATGGQRKDFVEAWLQHGPDSSFWTDLDLNAILETITVPTLLVGGWHDLYTAATIGEFSRLRDRGVDTALLMTATTHSGHIKEIATIYQHVIPWLNDAFAGHRCATAGNVTVQEVGTGQWRSLSQWPPADTELQQLHLQPGATLASAPASPTGGSDTFRYDPAEPTPSIGGELLSMSAKADNRPLAQRSDVLTYTAPTLGHDLLLGGVSQATLWWQCDGASFDVFVRLLDVAPDGRSTTITDAIRRVHTVEAGKPQQVTVEFPPTYARLAQGHRLQLLVAAGAHPRYLRNHGTADPFTKADQALPSVNTVHHDTAHPSALSLSVLPDNADTGGTA